MAVAWSPKDANVQDVGPWLKMSQPPIGAMRTNNNKEGNQNGKMGVKEKKKRKRRKEGERKSVNTRSQRYVVFISYEYI